MSPHRQATEKQLAALTKARAALAKKHTCERCGGFDPARGLQKHSDDRIYDTIRNGEKHRYCISCRIYFRWIDARQQIEAQVLSRYAMEKHPSGCEYTLTIPYETDEELALQTPPRSMAAIHRQVTTIAKEQGWKPPSYDRVRHIIKHLDPALVTMAHQGAAAYREEFDLLYRRESSHPNAMWQADHTPLDVLLLDEAGKAAKPWLTAIEDDYSRAIVGYRLSFQEATALTTALTLRTAIWRKEDPRWHACGIPTVFYSDHGPDFTSKHLEQVAADLPLELVFSQVRNPRGRGKIERFFRSVDQLLLQDTPGYAPKGSIGVKATLTLAAFETRFLLFPLTMLIAQSFDQLSPLVGSRQTRFLLDRVHFEQQCRAIQVAGIAGGSDHIGRKGSVLNQICHEASVGFQTGGVARIVAKNQQGNVFLTMRALLEAGRYLTRRSKRQGICLFDLSLCFYEAVKRGKRLPIGRSQAMATPRRGRSLLPCW